MRKLWVISILLIFGCHYGKTEYFPQAGVTDNPAVVTVIRNSNFIGSGTPVSVILDSRVIADMDIGEYMTFEVAPGIHGIGLPHYGLLSVDFKPGTYYFLISPDLTSFEIEQIDQAQAENLIGKYKPIQ